MSIVNLLEQNKNTMIPEHYLKMDQKEMEAKVWKIKQTLGKELFLPVHHYQKDEVVQFADTMGDSLQLAQVSAKNKDAKYIVFCGVHFMAETADILTDDNQKVFLPDMRAGCSRRIWRIFFKLREHGKNFSHSLAIPWYL